MLPDAISNELPRYQNRFHARIAEDPNSPQQIEINCQVRLIQAKANQRHPYKVSVLQYCCQSQRKRDSGEAGDGPLLLAIGLRQQVHRIRAKVRSG